MKESLFLNVRRKDINKRFLNVCFRIHSLFLFSSLVAARDSRFTSAERNRYLDIRTIYSKW